MHGTKVSYIPAENRGSLEQSMSYYYANNPSGCFPGQQNQYTNVLQLRLYISSKQLVISYNPAPQAVNTVLGATVGALLVLLLVTAVVLVNTCVALRMKQHLLYAA